uniref:Uncharacterized protein n=1 Tax=Spongospora subterranea TaxID=70186 RepID=A0A0H5R2B9_9EUKA|eukprot:CRZ08305.1 hypothetical protein [Spongospora subterranea]
MELCPVCNEPLSGSGSHRYEHCFFDSILITESLNEPGVQIVIGAFIAFAGLPMARMRKDMVSQSGAQNQKSVSKLSLVLFLYARLRCRIKGNCHSLNGLVFWKFIKPILKCRKQKWLRWQEENLSWIN